MKILEKHELDFNITWNYFQQNLDKVNRLSVELLKLLNLKNGRFFTLLPGDANFERIYDFGKGMILPNSKIFNNEKGNYSFIPTIRNELSALILNEIKSKENLSCIFDDVIRSSTDKPYTDLFHTYGLVHSNEIYYFIEKNNISSKNIIDCLRASTGLSDKKDLTFPIEFCCR